MAEWTHKRLGIAEMTPASQSLAIKFFWLSSTQIAQFQIASTFLVLFLLEIISFTELGILFATQFILTALLDYPTGALGDAIGHKNVLILAYCFYAVSLIFLIIGNSFMELIVFAALTAIGRSQESGALQSWFDNNYRITTGEHDSDRKLYGAFFGQIQAFSGVISGTMFIAGGVIAVVFSRKALFISQLCLVLLALGFIVFLMKNEEGIEVPQRTLKAYYDRLRGGLQFVASSRGVLLYFLSSAALFASIGIWGNLMLLPFYESYTGSDEYTGLLRAIIYTAGIFWGLAGARLSKQIQNIYRWLLLSTFYLIIVFFSIVFSFYELFPPPNAFVLTSFVGVILLFGGLGLSLSLALQSILRRRLMLELVPDKYRNAVYSLMPTLSVLFSVPLIIFGGAVIARFGISGGILLVISLGLIIVPALGLALYWLSKPEPIKLMPIIAAEGPSKDAAVKAAG
ncbi:MAG: MFS transporter [Candidatus Heimdallarchaeota archaeon]